MQYTRNDTRVTGIDVLNSLCSQFFLGAFYLYLVALSAYIVMIFVGLLGAGVYFAVACWRVALPWLLLGILLVTLRYQQNRPGRAEPSPISQTMFGPNPRWDDKIETSREWATRVIMEHKLEERTSTAITEDQIVKWISAPKSMNS